jgi:hypothetical protein
LEQQAVAEAVQTLVKMEQVAVVLAETLQQVNLFLQITE